MTDQMNERERDAKPRWEKNTSHPGNIFPISLFLVLSSLQISAEDVSIVVHLPSSLQHDVLYKHSWIWTWILHQAKRFDSRKCTIFKEMMSLRENRLNIEQVNQFSTIGMMCLPAGTVKSAQ